MNQNAWEDFSTNRAKEIRRKAKENHDKLNSCKMHEFKVDVTQEEAISKRWRCLHCEGEVSSTTKYWYEKGLEHEATIIR